MVPALLGLCVHASAAELLCSSSHTRKNIPKPHVNHWVVEKGFQVSRTAEMRLSPGCGDVTAGCTAGMKSRVRTAGVGCGDAGSFPGATVPQLLAAWQTLPGWPWVSRDGASTLRWPARPLHPAEGRAGAAAGAGVVVVSIQPPGRELLTASGGSPGSSCGCLLPVCRSER